MNKVKLVFVKSYLDIPTHKDTFAYEVAVEAPAGFDAIHLISARVCESDKAKGDSIHPSGDVTACIIDFDDVGRLVGQMLTYVDATFTDPEQRKAHKDIVKEKLYGWHQDMRERASQTVDSHSN